MSRKYSGRNNHKSNELSIAKLDIKAREEGVPKKTWTRHDLRSVRPVTPNQQILFDNYLDGYNICAAGSAGTGKTYLAMYLAFDDILNKDTHCDNIIIVRSAVTTRDKGFLPGDNDEKLAGFEIPYIDICSDLFRKRSTYGDMKKANIISFMDTSCIRGVTWNDAIVIIDEIENMNFHEIDSVMTRIGRNSKVIITGDIKQTDLLKNRSDISGMVQLLKVLQRMDAFRVTYFDRDDIVRSGFVRDWIIAVEETDGN